jgi:N4-gp56 family major capsid protein
MPATGSVALANEVQKVYDADYYLASQSQVYWDQLTNLRMLMNGQRGSNYEMPIIENLQPSTGALDELSDVTPQQMRANPITVPLAEYGNVVELTKFVTATSYSDVLRQAAEVNGYSFAESVDIIVRDTSGQGSRVVRANGRATRSAFIGSTTAADRLSVSNVERIIMIFARPSGMPLYEDGSVCSVMHPFPYYDLLQSSDVRTMGTRLAPELLFNGEIAYWSGLRIIVSRNAKAFYGAGAAVASPVATTLSAPLAMGDSTMFVASVTNITVGSWINIVDAVETGNTWTDTNEIVQVTRVGTAGAPGTGTGVDFFAPDGGPGNATYGPGGVRYAHSTVGTAITNASGVYPVVCMGPNSVIKVASDLTGPWGETVVTGPFDRLGRFVNVGWYGLFGYGRARESWLFRLEVGASEI